MPYLLLLIGLIFSVIGLYRYFLKASPREIKALFLSIAAVAVGAAALFLAVTGRLPVALAILSALWPLGVSWLRNRKPDVSDNAPMNEKEAYEVLGLSDGASDQEIKAAHIRLMKKVHPDQSGSDWLAKKINAAKDLLLNR